MTLDPDFFKNPIPRTGDGQVSVRPREEDGRGLIETTFSSTLKWGGEDGVVVRLVLEKENSANTPSKGT